MQTLGELLAGEDAERLAVARAEIAAELAAWNALTPEQQKAETDRVAAKYEKLFEDSAEYDQPLCDDCGEYEDDCTCQEGADDDAA